MTEIKLVIPDMKFETRFCAACGSDTVFCPKCGNDSCNGIYGCEICPLAYQYRELMKKNEEINKESSRLKDGLNQLMKDYK